MSVEAEREATASLCVVRAAIDPELDVVRRRTLSATWRITAVAFAVTVAFTVSTTLLALVPAAFVLGWLNLAGL